MPLGEGQQEQKKVPLGEEQKKVPLGEEQKKVPLGEEQQEVFLEKGDYNQMRMFLGEG
ncbi:MAG: hypothetical protein HFH39_07775 [Lachnospiraceae bacterium]|nr:hypothetical protein [Lachnospiraceae bacterium]